MGEHPRWGEKALGRSTPIWGEYDADTVRIGVLLKRLFDDVCKVDRHICYQSVKVDPPNPIESFKPDSIFYHGQLVPRSSIFEIIEVDFEVIAVPVRVRCPHTQFSLDPPWADVLGQNPVQNLFDSDKMSYDV